MEVTGGIDCGGCGDGSWGGDEGDDSVESTAGADEEAAAAAWQQSGCEPDACGMALAGHVHHPGPATRAHDVSALRCERHI